MNDLNVLLARVFRSSMLFMSGVLFAWIFLPEYRAYAAGLLLGITISLINARILAYKIHKITEVALANTGRKVGSGFVGRISMCLVGTMTALRFPQFNLVTTVIGFFFVQAVALLVGFIYNRLRKIT